MLGYITNVFFNPFLKHLIISQMNCGFLLLKAFKIYEKFENIYKE